MKKRYEQIYDAATKKLISDLESLNLSRTQRLRAKNLTLLFRDSFRLESVKHATFFIDAQYRYKTFKYDSRGFCRASSFAFIALMDNPDWQLMYIDEKWEYGPHFFVMHMPTQTPFDLTFDQFTYDGTPIPYELGRPRKIDGDGKNVVVRFLHATGLDFNLALKNIDRY